MKTQSGRNISKIGIGSYGIGGRGHRDIQVTEKLEDEKYLEALTYSFEKGFNFTEISLGYGHGQALKLFKKALDRSSVKRNDIFLTHSLYPRDLPTFKVIGEDIENFYEIMETDYADSTLVTQSLIIKFGEETIYPLLHNLLKSGKTKFVSLSNASLDGIKAFKDEFGDKFYAHEGHLSFEVRELQDKGVLELCDELGVKNIIWRPLRRGQTFNLKWELLVELVQKYNKTNSQVILNWMCNLGYYPMVFSLNKEHIDQNFSATDFEMSEEDYQRITIFRPQNYHPPEIHWDSLQTDDDIVSLVKDFEIHLS